jgi:hypothetical protein
MAARASGGRCAPMPRRRWRGSAGSSDPAPSRSPIATRPMRLRGPRPTRARPPWWSGRATQGACGGILPGTTGEHLLAAAPCPVGVAPRGYDHHAELSIDVVACAYVGTAEAWRVLRMAEDIARRHDAALRLVQVDEVSQAVDAVLAVDPQVADAARRLRDRMLNELH